MSLCTRRVWYFAIHLLIQHDHVPAICPNLGQSPAIRVPLWHFGEWRYAVGGIQRQLMGERRLVGVSDGNLHVHERRYEHGEKFVHPWLHLPQQSGSCHWDVEGAEWRCFVQ